MRGEVRGDVGGEVDVDVGGEVGVAETVVLILSLFFSSCIAFNLYLFYTHFRK